MHCKSGLTAGIAAIGVTALSVASVAAPPAEVADWAPQVTTTSTLTPAMVELLAAVQRITDPANTPPTVMPGDRLSPPALAASAAPLPVDARSSVASPHAPTNHHPPEGSSEAVAPQAFALPPSDLLGGLADLIDNSYNATESVVRAVVDAIEDGLTLLGVPKFLATQGTILYTFAEGVFKSVLFNATDWLRGEGTFFTNMDDLANDLIAAGVWLVADELMAFNLLPPTPIVIPRPPWNQDASPAAFLSDDGGVTDLEEEQRDLQDHEDVVYADDVAEDEATAPEDVAEDEAEITAPEDEAEITTAAEETEDEAQAAPDDTDAAADDDESEGPARDSENGGDA